jgi:hypothetical protein
MSARADDRPRRPASPRRRFIVATLMASPIGLALVAYVFVSHSASRRLENAIATADRLDPGWRMGPLIDHRATPKPDENSADVVASMSRVPLRIRDSATTPDDRKARASRERDLDFAISALESPKPLPADVAVTLAAVVEERSDAIVLGRTLAAMGEGHHKLIYDRFVINTLLTHAPEARWRARLLQKDAILRADRGDVSGAIESSRAALGVARSLGDEPFAVSQLVRMACETVGLSTFERVLSQGKASAEALARIQADFARDEKQPLLLYAAAAVRDARRTRGGLRQPRQARDRRGRRLPARCGGRRGPRTEHERDDFRPPLRRIQPAQPGGRARANE